MQKRKFVNISINYSQNSLVYDELKEYVEKVAKENMKLLYNPEISHDTAGLFHAFDIDDSDYKFSARVVNEGNDKTLLYGFYDNNKHIIIDNIFDNELLSLRADDANIVCDRLSFVIKRNLRNISPEIDSAWKAYEFLYKEACRFIKENQFDYNDFSIRTGSCIDLKLTNNYKNDCLNCLPYCMMLQSMR